MCVLLAIAAFRGKLKLGALAIPVMLYIAAIVVMAMLSLRVPAIEVRLGAAQFMSRTV